MRTPNGKGGGMRTRAAHTLSAAAAMARVHAGGCLVRELMLELEVVLVLVVVAAAASAAAAVVVLAAAAVAAAGGQAQKQTQTQTGARRRAGEKDVRTNTLANTG